MIEGIEVFVAHRFDNEDIRYTIEQAMEHLGVITYFADQEVTSDLLLGKLWRKISSVSVIIADVSLPNPNVYFEIGMAIGLNQPILLVACIEEEVRWEPPRVLQGVEVLSSNSLSKLKSDLINRFPKWYDEIVKNGLEFSSRLTSGEVGWCHFASIVCDYRYLIQSHQRYLVLDQIKSIGPAENVRLSPNPDLRDCICETLSPLQEQSFFLDEVELQPTKPFELCKYCIAARRSNFVVSNIGSGTDTDIYVLAGLFFTLMPNRMFWMKRQGTSGDDRFFQAPTVMHGFDFFEYKSINDARRNLSTKVEKFMKRFPLPPDVALRKILEQDKYLVPEIKQENWSPEALLWRGRLFFFLGDISKALTEFEKVLSIRPEGKIAGWVTAAGLCDENIEAASRGLRDFYQQGRNEPDYNYYVEIYEAWLETLIQGSDKWQSLVDRFLKEEMVWDLEGMPHVHFELALGLASTGYRLLAWRALQRIWPHGLQEHYWWGLASMSPFQKLHADAEVGSEFEKWFNRYCPRFLPELKSLQQVIQEWHDKY